MLYLMFQLGTDRYALDASQVTEVLPLVSFKVIPHAAPGLVGIFNYRGVPVPAIDLNLLTLGRPAQERLSTRIVLVRYPDRDGDRHLLGLIAERVTQTLRLELADFAASGVDNASAPYLGPINVHASGLIQRIEVDRMLSVSVRDQLFAHQAPV